MIKPSDWLAMCSPSDRFFSSCGHALRTSPSGSLLEEVVAAGVPDLRRDPVLLLLLLSSAHARDATTRSGRFLPAPSACSSACSVASLENAEPAVSSGFERLRG